MSIRALFLRHAAACYSLGLALLLLSVYLAFPTRNHYWDGIGFALNIEGVPQDHAGHDAEQPHSGAVYYNPNHLLYNAVGRLLFVGAKSLWSGARALDVLVLWSIASSVTAACLLFRLLVAQTGRHVMSLWLTLLFGFSATWWKFSTDANAYVPSTALLVGCAWLAGRRELRPPVVVIGALHALAMLLHQIAIWFYPAMWMALAVHRSLDGRRERLRAAAVYTAVSAALVTAAYGGVWFLALERAWDPAAFLNWLTFNGSDVLVRKPAVEHAADMMRATLRLFFGGKVSLALRHWHPAALAVPALVAVWALGVIGVAAWRRRSAAGRQPVRRGDVRFAAVWLGAFLVFLSFWLTEFAYYRLFCLPAMVLLAATMLRGKVGARPAMHHPLPALVALVAAANFALYIYPYSRPEASPPLHMALHASNEWRQPVVVYYSEFNCDNWWLKYFNMHTRWRKADPRNQEHLKQRAREAIGAGHRVFLDTGLVTHLDRDGGARTSLEQEFVWTERFGVSNGKHHIRFAELRPKT